jgi:hypothetical protein
MTTNTTTQAYESWKGTTGTYPARNAIVPSNSRPSTNGVNDNPNDYQSAFGTARPLKIWRKQLIPPKKTASASRVSGSQLSRPGGSVSTGTDVNCPSCADNTNVASVNTMVFGNNSYLTTATPNNVYANADYITDPANNIYDKCVSCDPVSNVIKTGVTKLNKKYYTTSKAYLYARCKTFDQKAMTEKRTGITYIDSNGKPVLPSDSENGSQVYNMPTCSAICEATGKRVSTIYKPSNAQYAVQGAVDSSTRMMRLRQQAMNKNGASFASAYGAAAANAGKYSTIDTPYFVKSKVNICNPGLYYRVGHKTMCYNR